MGKGRKTVGIIGGSGLYAMEGLKGLKEVRVRTPFGKPSDSFVTGELDGTSLVFLARHGRGHRWLPTELNFRANIFGMKKIGVDSIISISAVGSLREEIAPGCLVVPDQFIDRTTQRESTFFGRGVVAHVSFADPFCSFLREALIRAGGEEGANVYPGGTYVCMEGPQFSTRAESHLYRGWGAHVIGMTNIQEAKLAREAEICFATLALSTDYDCWNDAARDVAIEEVLAILKGNVRLSQRVIRRTLPLIREGRTCVCSSSLKDAIITDRSKIPAKVRKELGLLIDKYL